MVFALGIASFIMVFCYEKKYRGGPTAAEESTTATAEDVADQATAAVQKGVNLSPIYVAELSHKSFAVFGAKHMFRKSDLYIYLVLLMGIFYGIPAIELALRYVRVALWGYWPRVPLST